LKKFQPREAERQTEATREKVKPTAILQPRPRSKQTIEHSPSDTHFSQPQRKRGRPRKNFPKPVEPVECETQFVPPVKRRGRPPKNNRPTENTQQESTHYQVSRSHNAYTTFPNHQQPLSNEVNAHQPTRPLQPNFQPQETRRYNLRSASSRTQRY
jgi:hypothetical protein